MARIRKTFCYADTRGELAEYKDARRGASEDAFWDEDELIDYRRTGKRKGKKPRAGCPGNDGNAHVYVWVVRKVSFAGFYRDREYTYEIRVCCGCEKRGRGYRSIT